MLPVTGMSSNVRGDIDYQDYRDFAENRGRFVPGALNITIYTKSGARVGVLSGASMPDFSAADRLLGVSTLVTPQYLFGVRHNGGYGSVEFGGRGSNPGYRRHTYLLIDRNNSDSIDIHAPRLDKVVTEVAPAAVPEAGMTASGFLDARRFPLFYRLGSGTQSVDGTGVAGAYQYLTGGTVARPNWADWRVNIVTNLYNVDTDGPLGNQGAPGDSGSPLFTWDAQRSRWLLAGTLSTGGGPTSQYVAFSPDFLTQVAEADSDGTVSASDSGGNIRWAYNASAGTGTLTQGSRVTTMHGLAGTDLNTGKNLTFGPRGGTVVLVDSVNQGAGTLTFQGKWTVIPQGVQTWQGGGIITAAGSDVSWQVNGAGGDSLHKIGTGTLRINATGVNPGDLSAGDGIVVLDQQQDASGHKQAFRAVDIVSGRPTVVLNSEDQVSTDSLNFGYRGGRLDLSGHSLTFGRINAVDDGARIVNHSANPASLIVTGSSGYAGTFVYPGRFGEDDPFRPNQPMSVDWQPTSESAVMAVTGGMNLNGSLRATKGVLLLSGRPVLHANNVTVPDDWTVSDFRSTATDVASGAAFQVGEYATFLTSGLTVWPGARVAFGYNESLDPAERLWRCTLDDNSGVSSCGQPLRNAHDAALLPPSLVSGNVTMAQGAQLLIGKALWAGRLASYPTAVTTLHPGAVWQVTGDSRAGVLNALPGSTVDMAVATQGRWEPKLLQVQRFNATGLTVGLGADPAGARADRLDILDSATGLNNVLQVSFLSDLPGTLTAGGGLVLATAPADTPQDYFSLTPVNQGFTIWRTRLQSQEMSGRRVWAVSPVNPSSRSLLALRSAVLKTTKLTTEVGVMDASASEPPDSPAVPPTPSTLGNDKEAVLSDGLSSDLAPVWFTPEENTELTDATRRQLSVGESLLSSLAVTDARRATDLLLSGSEPGSWTTLSGSRTVGTGRSGTVQTLSFGADTGDGGLMHGLSVGIAQAKSDSNGALGVTAEAGSAGGWVTARTEYGWFGTADLRGVRLGLSPQPETSLAIPKGDMVQTGLRGQLRFGHIWQTDGSDTTLAPWAGLRGGWLSGARLAGGDNALIRPAGTSLWAGVGLDARRVWHINGGFTLAVNGGMSTMRPLTTPGVDLEDASGLRHYGTDGETEQNVYAGLDAAVTQRLTLSLTASRRNDGAVRETGTAAGLRWSF